MAMKDRGFGSMDPARQQEIARMGGKAAHAKGTAHEWTPETARAAGKKGGRATTAKKLSAAKARGLKRAGKATAGESQPVAA